MLTRIEPWLDATEQKLRSGLLSWLPGLDSCMVDDHYDGPPQSGITAQADISDLEETSTTETSDEIALVRRATEVLGIEHVARWMRSNIPSLDNQTPYALMKTEDGRKQVERVLLKIEHGVY